MNIITIITSFATLIALGFTIYQAKLTRDTLKETKKSIDQEKINRQISMLPKFEWIIQVDVQLKIWQEELEEKTKKLQQALADKNGNILKELSMSKRVAKPSDLRLSKYDYEKMPEWLSQLWLSGAQYYYQGLGSLDYLYKDDKPYYLLAETLLLNCGNCAYSISELRGYISDMIPEVILETPASIGSSEFFRD